MKVCKFGGSSVADAVQIKKVKEIIQSDRQRVYVVPSAPGKRFDDDSKVTDILYAYHAAVSRGKRRRDFRGDRQRFIEIRDGLGVSTDIESHLNKIAAESRRRRRGHTVSRGEYLNGLLLADYLGFDFIDPAG